MKYTFEKCRDSYLPNWHDMTVRPSRRDAVRHSARRILEGRERYQKIENATGVPWFVVGLIHKMESDLSWTRHIHNGDSLIRRTRLVPAGRPATGSPPFTWEESAIDALTMKGKEFHKIKDWPLERIAYSLELFNGFGYRPRGVPSPYLWSFSTVYTSGKYVRDHVWSASAVSEQSGALVLLKSLMDIDSGIRDRVIAGKAPEPAPADESETLPRTPSLLSALLRSRTLLGSVWASIGLAVTKAAEVVGNPAERVAEVATEAGGLAESLTHLATLLGWSLAGIGVAACLYGLALVAHARISAQLEGKIG